MADSEAPDIGRGSSPPPPRVVWKGAISFGLVHIPVALYAATSSSGVDFDWLDRRTMEPVGYKRINKKTGKEIAASDIVKGVEVEDGRYVVLSAEEIKAAFPKSTQTIEIETFVKADEIPLVYLERPYYLAPINRGEKVYALLREALQQSGRVGVARVVISAKQHLAVLMPTGRALILNLLRWGGEIRSWEELKLPPADAKAAGLKDAEIRMARQLIDDMTAPWDADAFRDSFRDEIMRLVQAKAKAGELEQVDKVESDPASTSRGGAEIIDLTELLKRSLQGGGKEKTPSQSKDAADAGMPSGTGRASPRKTATSKNKEADDAPATRTTASRTRKRA